MPDITIRSAILCDFCRPELGGKITLIGTMAGDILVPALPAAIPISAYLEVNGIPIGSHHLTIQFETPDGISDVVAGVDSHAEGLGAMPLPQLTLQVSKPGPLIIRIKLNDGPWVEAISRKILEGPVPQA
jgi:hypothetical protein